MYLETINKVNDIKKIPSIAYSTLANEIRQFLVENVSKTGGHLAANLGVVELTMALHLSFDLPKDQLIWDVGHQAYTHKILSGRKEQFHTLRQQGGLSGFPKRKESPCDCFDTGHSTTSISAGVGMAHARDLLGEDNFVVSIIGDGSLTGGMAYEALNNASSIKGNYIIVLNDNTMSISENVGGINNFLGRLRTSKTYNGLKESVTEGLRRIPHGDELYDVIRSTKGSVKQLVIRNGMMFEDMDIVYLGPVDGHNIQQLKKAFRNAKQVKGPVLVHVLTQKGKGYSFAEQNPSKFHGIGPFDILTGDPIGPKENASYTKVFSDCMIQLGKQHADVVAITAAMSDGTGLASFAKKFPKRFFDVGIAEQHAVTFAAGMATKGFKPYVAIYSSFLQRAYDQILHDVCMQNLPVVFAIDRAGIVGQDGETHQGIFDLSYLTCIPNLTVAAPKNAYEFVKMMRFSYTYDKPLAIRYPRGEALLELKSYAKSLEIGKAEIMEEDEDAKIVFLALGTMVKTAMDVRVLLQEKKIPSAVVNLRFAKPLDYTCLEHFMDYDYILTLEENVFSGGIGEQIAAYYASCKSNDFHAKVININTGDQFIPHGTCDLLKQQLGLDASSVLERLEESMKINGETI